MNEPMTLDELLKFYGIDNKPSLKDMIKRLFLELVPTVDEHMDKRGYVSKNPVKEAAIINAHLNLVRKRINEL